MLPTFDDVANQTPAGLAYQNAHDKAKLIDPRFITKFPLILRLPANINPPVKLFDRR